VFIDTYGEEVLALVKKMDDEDKDTWAMMMLANHQAKRQATEAAKAAMSQSIDMDENVKPTCKGAQPQGQPLRGKSVHQIPRMSRYIV